jgi:membrane associated rhomboid family serine protease
MIPLRDNIKSRHFPWMNWLLIIANVLAFLFELALGSNQLDKLTMSYGLVPVTFLSNPAGYWWTILTSMFMHGGWLHLISNMLALFIFGDNIEDRFGHFRYLIFYVAGGFAAGIMHALTNAGSAVPTIGASGAIAAVLGAYLILYPRARVLTIFPIFFFIQIVQVPAPLYLIIWFFSQLLNGTAEIVSNTYQGGGTAWWAHIGGFTFGVLIALIFYRRSTQRPASVWEHPEVITRDDMNNR